MLKILIVLLVALTIFSRGPLMAKGSISRCLVMGSSSDVSNDKVSGPTILYVIK